MSEEDGSEELLHGTKLSKEIGASLSWIVRNVLPDEAVTLGGTKELPQVFLGKSKVKASFPADLPLLESLCSQAPFGRGMETVLDTTVRKVLETDQCRIVWDLQYTLNEISKRFSLPQTITAQFYKLLYYREGDFFLQHIDSKKSPQHSLTLAVDVGSQCTGGELHFPQINTRKRTENSESTSLLPLIWRSNEFSWACWFATHPHEVKPLVSGYRLVAVYNIDVPDTEVPIRYPALSPAAQTTSSSNTSLLDLPPDILQSVAGHIAAGSLKSLRDFALSCKRFRDVCRHHSAIFGAWLRKQRPVIENILRRSASDSIGFVLQHKYSFDGRETLPLCRLHGRDRALLESFQLAFQSPSPNHHVKICVRPCFVRVEMVDDENFDLQEVHIARAITLQEGRVYEDRATIAEGEKKYLPPGFKQNEPKKINWYRILSRGTQESDEMLRERFWPFWHTVWLNDLHYLKCTHPTLPTQFSMNPTNLRKIFLGEAKDFDAAAVVVTEATEAPEEEPDEEGEAESRARAYGFQAPHFLGTNADNIGNGASNALYWYFEAALFVKFHDILSPEQLESGLRTLFKKRRLIVSDP